MDAGAVLSAVLGVLTLVSVVASAVAVARATLAKTTIETLTQSNAALTERVGILEGENSRQTTRLAALLAENAALQTYVSGSEAIKELAASMARQEHMRASEHHDILSAIQTIPMIVTSHHEETLAIIKAMDDRRAK